MEDSELVLLVIPGCSNSGSAKELFDTALAPEGINVPAIVREISTGQEATKHSFQGSPSFSINGNDLFESSAEPAVAWRV